MTSRRNLPVAHNASASNAFQALDLLATLVAVVGLDGTIRYVNAALEDALGLSRRTVTDHALADFFTEPALLVNALDGARGNEFAALRYDAWLKRPADAQP